MASKDIVLEAKNIVDTLAQRIDSRVLSKAVELKPRIVSLAQRMYDLSSMLSSILGALAERAEAEKDKRILRLGSWFYAVLARDSFVVIRSKPYTMVLSYHKDEGKLYLRTRNYTAVFTPSTIEMKYLAMKERVDPGSPKEIAEKQSELKYLLKRLGRIIEFQLLPVAEKRLVTG